MGEIGEYWRQSKLNGQYAEQRRMNNERRKKLNLTWSEFKALERREEQEYRDFVKDRKAHPEKYADIEWWVF